jgi:HPt (histidine-containing phosphotransfer) domain-containing protein
MEMLEIFLADFAGLMDGVSQSLRNGERQDVARAAHAVKSAATSACAKPLAQILDSIERQATDADLSHLEQMLAGVSLEFSRVQAQLAADARLRPAAP